MKNSIKLTALTLLLSTGLFAAASPRRPNLQQRSGREFEPIVLSDSGGGGCGHR